MAETSDFAAKANQRCIVSVIGNQPVLSVDCSDTTELDEDEEEDYSCSDVSDAIETPSPGAKGFESISFNPNVGKLFLCKHAMR
jgi:hypothetical protein